MSTTTKKLVGLTIGMIDDFKAVESNSLLMNVIFLYEMIEKSNKYIPILIVCDSKDTDKKQTEKLQYYNRQYNYELLCTTCYKLDIFIEVFFDFGIELHKTFLKLNPNLKFIHVSYGNSFVIDTCYYLYLGDTKEDLDVENLNNIANHTPENTLYKDYNQLWISPHFRYSEDYYIAKYNIKEHQLMTARYIWDDWIQEIRNKEVGFDINPIIYHKTNVLNIGIFEANLHLIKTSIIPIYIAEYLYNNYKDKVNIGKVYITNLHHLHKRELFYNHIQSLNLYKDGKIHLSKNACRFPQFMKAFNINFVICHQMLNQLNYLHLELFKLGIPFIHNCQMIRDLGYYYKEFEIRNAAKEIPKICHYHNLDDKTYMENYNGRCKAVLYRYSPSNIKNINKTEEFLDKLF